MAILSLEQQRQRERADEKANKIMEDVRAYDLAHSKCPVDRRIAEKQAERKALEAREAEQSKQTTNWMRWIDQRIAQWFKSYFDGEDGEQYEDGHRYGHYTAALGQVIAEERRGRRKEVKDAIEEERQSVDAKLETLEQASNDRWAVIDQRIVQHIERAREPVLQGTGEVLGQFRAELKEFKGALEEKERLFEAKLDVGCWPDSDLRRCLLSRRCKGIADMDHALSRPMRYMP